MLQKSTAQSLEEVKIPGVQRKDWPHKQKPDKILGDHSRQFDWMIGEMQRHGEKVDESAMAQAKDHYLQTLGHMLNHADANQIEHLKRLRIMPWKGANDALYSPQHHSIMLGDKAAQGGYKEHTKHPGAMMVHELAHSLDLSRDGKSRMGEEIEKKLKGKKPIWVPRTLTHALMDHREWAPRLTEMALYEPERFQKVSERMQKEHGVNLPQMMKKHLALEVKNVPAKPEGKGKSGT